MRAPLPTRHHPMSALFTMCCSQASVPLPVSQFMSSPSPRDTRSREFPSRCDTPWEVLSSPGAGPSWTFPFPSDTSSGVPHPFAVPSSRVYHPHVPLAVLGVPFPTCHLVRVFPLMCRSQLSVLPPPMSQFPSRVLPSPGTIRITRRGLSRKMETFKFFTLSEVTWCCEASPNSFPYAHGVWCL